MTWNFETKPRTVRSGSGPIAGLTDPGPSKPRKSLSEASWALTYGPVMCPVWSGSSLAHSRRRCYVTGASLPCQNLGHSSFEGSSGRRRRLLLCGPPLARVPRTFEALASQHPPRAVPCSCRARASPSSVSGMPPFRGWGWSSRRGFFAAAFLSCSCSSLRSRSYSRLCPPLHVSPLFLLCSLSALDAQDLVGVG